MMARAIAVLAWLLLFSSGYVTYPGSKFYFVVFSVVFLGLLLIASYRPITNGTFLLAGVIWIGFWLKLILHSKLRYSGWVEPVGMFDGSPDAWNEVLLVSTAGAGGIMAAVVLWRWKMTALHTWDKLPLSAPVWYISSVRYVLWALVALAVVATVSVNEVFAVIKLGYRPALSLPWPWQGVFGWWCNIGLALSLAVLLGFDHAKNHSLWPGIIGLLFSALLVSVTIFSRGIYVFYAIPLLLVLWQLRRHTDWMNQRRLILIIAGTMMGMLLSVALAQFQRHAGLEALPESEPISKGAIAADFPNLLQRLSIDRWLGLEGVMAVSAYPGKGMSLFAEAAAERRTKDKADMYTGKISQSGFTDADTARYHYATMPGAIGFLYLSASYWVVFVGMVALTLMLLASEVIAYRITGNPYICSLAGMYITLLIIQMGAGGVVQPLTSYITTMVAVLAIGLISRIGRPHLRPSPDLLKP